MSDDIMDLHRNYFDRSFSMLMQIIEICPETIWEKAMDDQGFPVWQYVYHVLGGIWVWCRPSTVPFSEPPAGRSITELEVRAEEPMTKEQVYAFAKEVEARVDVFFVMIDEGEGLLAPSVFYNTVTNLDVILMQIRHIQHHVGYCNSILGEMGVAVAWK